MDKSFEVNLSDPSSSYHDMATSADMDKESQRLLVGMHDIENMIRMFPVTHMTADRLLVYNEELKEIKDKFREFSTQVLSFSMSFINVTDVPRTQSGE